jgi:pantoate--beta-alanine ligase
MKIVEDLPPLASFHGCALVPTMGALHRGHASLIERASLSGLPVVVTLFVNPTQFAPGEDYARYPRTLESDLALCRQAGVTALFMPTTRVMYPHGVEAALRDAAAQRLPPVATRPGLEDANRPTHFAGVQQVVSRLFDLCRPAVAFFGEKDFQQLRVIQEMVRLDDARWRGLDIRGCPTVRESDGLAMSSRNRYLRDDQRSRALGLSAALAQAAAAARDGADPTAAESTMRRVLLHHDLAIDYAVVRDPRTLMPVGDFAADARALIAARLDGVRLIDNALIGRGERLPSPTRAAAS